MSIVKGSNIFTGVMANTISAPKWVGDFDIINMTVTVSGATEGNGLTVSFPCSTKTSARPLSDTPVFTTSASATNPWSYAAFTDINTLINYAGSTGAVFNPSTSGKLTNGTYQFQINNVGVGIAFIGAQISGYANGTVTVDLSNISRNTD